MAEINGRAVGAGHELSAQMDMRFAGPKAHVGHTENGLGLFAVVRRAVIPRLVGE
jgi:enoyl-CoA hydratase/carnithine racemase